MSIRIICTLCFFILSMLHNVKQKKSSQWDCPEPGRLLVIWKAQKASSILILSIGPTPNRNTILTDSKWWIWIIHWLTFEFNFYHIYSYDSSENKYVNFYLIASTTLLLRINWIYFRCRYFDRLAGKLARKNIFWKPPKLCFLP